MPRVPAGVIDQARIPQFSSKPFGHRHIPAADATLGHPDDDPDGKRCWASGMIVRGFPGITALRRPIHFDTRIACPVRPAAVFIAEITSGDLYVAVIRQLTPPELSFGD